MQSAKPGDLILDEEGYTLFVISTKPYKNKQALPLTHVLHPKYREVHLFQQIGSDIVVSYTE